MTTLELPICYNDATYIRVAERALTRSSAVAQRSDPMDVHHSTIPAATIERFWSKVDKSAGPDACWPWTAGLARKGYGWARVGARMDRAHRIAYSLVTGAIPPGALIMHTCDNPPCCNPAHLVAGTNLDNVRDRDAKGRQARGQKNSQARLTEEIVSFAKRANAGGVSFVDLGRQFGCDESTIRFAVQGKSWRHVDV